MATARYSIWLGSEASIWGHRGYRVRGERVEGVTSMRDARRIVRESLRGSYVSAKASDGIYCYHDRAAMLRDDTGCAAVAVICRAEEA